MTKNVFGKILGWVLLMTFLMGAFPAAVLAAPSLPVAQPAPVNPQPLPAMEVQVKPQPMSASASPSGTVEPAGWKSASVKLALKGMAKMLRSKALDTILDWMEREASKTIAGQVRKHAKKIAGLFDELVQWEQLTLKMVQDQTAGLLYDLGVNLGTAREVAFWICTFLEWVLL